MDLPSKLTDLTLTAARAALDAKACSAVELVQAHVDAMARLADLNAFVTPTPEQALAQAKGADERLAKGEGGPMEGLPIAMKDLFCTEGVRTTASSKILETFVPPYSATVAAKLAEAGAITVGKASLDEFAMGSSNLTSAYGPVRNPWTRKDDAEAFLVPGGSSGGSAAAVAARMALGATGTDTGGSIRQPAAFCGLVGLKPTYGRCSRWGIVAFASSLDQAGPLTRTVADAALMLGAMAGHDPKDSTSAAMTVPDLSPWLSEGVRGLRVGIPKEYRMDGMDPAIEALWQQGAAWLKAAGAEIKEITLPHTKYALPTYYVVASAEASSNLARYDGVRYGSRVVDEGDSLDDLYRKTRAAGFGREVKRRIMIGTYVLSAGYYDAYYLKAQQVRRKVSDDFTKAFEDVDVVLTPTAPSAAFARDAKLDPVTMYLNDVFTVPASLAGLPAISVPAGLTEKGLPLGLQLIAPSFGEHLLIRAGAEIERAAAFTHTPSLMA